MDKVESFIQQYKNLNLHDVVDYDKFNQYAITAHSTQIEGSTLTIGEASLLIDEGITPKGKPLEHSLMVKDHHLALKLAIDFGEKKHPVSVKMICELNGAVTKSTGKMYHTVLGPVDSSKGELRKGSVLVQQRYFPSYDKVPGLLEKLALQLNDKMKGNLSIREQIDLSYSAHFNLVSIHPHYDGNGRTSRLLMNLIQSRHNLPLSVVFKEDRQDYFNSLEESRNKESLQPFRDFMDTQYIKYLSGEINRFQEQTNQKSKGSGMTFLY